MRDIPNALPCNDIGCEIADKHDIRVAETTVRSSETRRFYAWASDFLSPLAHHASSNPFNVVKWKDIKF